MSDKKRKYFSGKTLQQAVIAAACEYELTPEEVAYRKIEKRHGFIRSPKKVLIAVDPEAPRLERKAAVAEAPSSRPAPAPAPAPAPSAAAPSAAAPSPPPAAAPVAGRKERAGTDDAAPRPSRRTRPEPQSGDASPERQPRDDRGRGGRGGPRRAPADRAATPRVAAARSTAPGPSAARGKGPRRGPGRPGIDAPVDPVALEQAAHARRAMELEQAEEQAARQQGKVAAAPAKPKAVAEVIEHQIPADGHPAEVAMAHLVAVTGLDIQAKVSVDGDEVQVEIKGPDAELLLESDGKPLSAMEHLLPKVIRGISGEKLFCHIDCLGFREMRQGELEGRARKLADEVRETGDSRTLDPLNPAERRIVHMALADDPDVETESSGGGYLKKLTIWPA